MWDPRLNPLNPGTHMAPTEQTAAAIAALDPGEARRFSQSTVGGIGGLGIFEQAFNTGIALGLSPQAALDRANQIARQMQEGG